MKPIYTIKETYVNTNKNNAIIDVITHRFETYQEAKSFAKRLNHTTYGVVLREKGVLVLNICNSINVIYTYQTEIEL